MSDQACRQLRPLLGVYVVGAIDPADRSTVEAHLEQCWACREELAGLAGLPALLGRVPLAEAERLVLASGELDEDAVPSELMLPSLLRQAAARRKARRWRGIAAAAAAAVIVAGGSAAVATTIGSPSPARQETVQMTNAATGVHAVVAYSPTGWGTAMRVEVTGVPHGTNCSFWVVNSHGNRSLAGTWTSSGPYSTNWYPATAGLAAGSIHSFQLTSAGKVLVTIPAS